ncbi:TetR family transcriptional regulator [Galactobacter valiniphilus]|uniref:TetR family transcriptional regulator n=1 Tax=Galactobacter valiniphilus TaxID=2676122 RepID=A0A399JHA3_9MICC|nr:TetR family transcriptional regulator [Galactobacter valiniphilus]RII43609.1 TetR family transcriptional regulator [Galactobacter valiniphilus]
MSLPAAPQPSDAVDTPAGPRAPRPTQPGGAPVEGLRERRRRETAAEVHRAAIECVEREGLEAATVAKIAEAAGISARTFFRYFPSKEAAILPGQSNLGRALERLLAAAPLAEPSPERALATLVGTLEALIAEDEVDHREHLRIGLLMESEPALRAHVASEDAELIRLAAAVLQALAPGYDEGDARFQAEFVFTAQRIAWRTWDALGPTEECPTPLSRWRWGLSRLAPNAARVAGTAPANG